MQLSTLVLLGGGSGPPSCKSQVLGGGSGPPSCKYQVLGGGGLVGLAVHKSQVLGGGPALLAPPETRSIHSILCVDFH